MSAVRNAVLFALIVSVRFSFAQIAPSVGSTQIDTVGTLEWSGAVTEVLARNPDAGLALLAIEAARADRDRADARPNPSLTLTDTGWRRRGPVSSDSNLTAQVDQSIERGNKRGLRVGAAQAQVNAAGDDLLDTRRQLLQLLAEAFIDVTAASAKLNLSREIAQSVERAAQLAQKRVDAGDLAPTDAVRARADAARAQNDVTVAGQEQALARVQLAQVLGRPGQSEDLNVDVTGVPARVPADLTEIAEQRADVRAARSRLEAAETAVNLAQALRTRDVSVGVSMAHAPQDPGPSLGLSVTVPLFTNYYFEGEIRRAMADRDSAKLLLEKARQTATTDVRRAARTLASAIERERRIREDIVPLARKAADATQFAFSRGAGTILDVLDARRQQRAAEVDGIAALADVRRARAALALLEPGVVPAP